ncbi:hypothetical protein J6590_069995 [Homalodisca vitripennis]|nr:hypothetical protein J6590_069995 [Homalodisca vitripennis]
MHCTRSAFSLFTGNSSGDLSNSRSSMQIPTLKHCIHQRLRFDLFEGLALETFPLWRGQCTKRTMVRLAEERERVYNTDLPWFTCGLNKQVPRTLGRAGIQHLGSFLSRDIKHLEHVFPVFMVMVAWWTRGGGSCHKNSRRPDWRGEVPGMYKPSLSSLIVRHRESSSVTSHSPSCSPQTVSINDLLELWMEQGLHSD